VKNKLGLLRSHKLHVSVHGRLPASFALGWHLSDAAHFSLILEGRNGIWSTQETIIDKKPLVCSSNKCEGDARVAVVEISISRRIGASVDRDLPSFNLSFGHRIQFEIKGGPRTDSVKSAAQALAIARQIGQKMKDISDSGVKQIHLFLEGPGELMVLIGHQLNAVGAITVYHHLKGEESRYIPGYTLTHY
jgi:hypothetical protein